MALYSLQNLINRLENQDEWKMHQRFKGIVLHWPSIVGDVVATRTRPVGIQQDVLRVAVCNAVWAQNLAFERQRIVQKLNDRFPDLALTDIRFSTTQWHSEKARSEVASDTNPEILDLWRSHPSHIQSDSEASPQRHLSVVPKAPEEAFQKWADHMQRRSQHLPLCPTCGCPTPTGELHRWNMCGLCASQQLF